jgi:hypothetical protein
MSVTDYQDMAMCMAADDFIALNVDVERVANMHSTCIATLQLYYSKAFPWTFSDFCLYVAERMIAVEPNRRQEDDDNDDASDDNETMVRGRKDIVAYFKRDEDDEDADDDDPLPPGRCWNCSKFGPLGTYCVTCGNSGLVYESYASGEAKRIRKIHDRRTRARQPVPPGRCVNCGNFGPLGNYCHSCEDSGMIYDFYRERNEYSTPSAPSDKADCSESESESESETELRLAQTNSS